MKKIILFVFFSFSLISLAQDEEQTDSQNRLDSFTSIKKRELSLDVTAALVLPAISPRYEHILGRYSGVGADLFILLDNDDDVDYSDLEKFSFTPYYRQYFFSKEDYGAKGFYAEGFLKFFTYEDYDQFPSGFDDTENYFETAIGVGIGWKWVSNSGFLIDLGLGFGRDLGIADDPVDDIDIRVRGGLNFGWRF
ncbi:hypothetical protein AAU57_13635 [Nonlabens sp. YIK11]|uniref:hypothetical protein n=1 Tax=Nonlabens sp. YIK11 TaxID=1453349 RepID=UPI0006DCAA39|nr:hypothetical protein [Nonlabens sp. YIK11]KQC34261.1 hypothetical protein AAU57_13635 [Nonlabens sp. YIK11]